MRPKKDKEQVFFAICNSVLKLEVTKGHLRWRPSDVASDAKITRSLIYYYFGKDKEALLEESLRYMITLFFVRPPDVRLRERVKQILDRTKAMPWLFILFVIEKGRDTKLSRLIKDAEAKLIEDMEKRRPALSKTEILGIYLLELGCLAYGDVSQAQMDELFSGF